MTDAHTIEYKPDGKTLDAFLLSDAFFRYVIGPFGSGKSASCAVELFRRACQQKPDRKGRRRTKWGAVRATYPQLDRSTIETWRQWFDHLAAFRMNPTPEHHLIVPLALRMNVTDCLLDVFQCQNCHLGSFLGPSFLFIWRVRDQL